MKVYILERCYPYDGNDIVGVFHSKAEAEIAKLSADEYDRPILHISEWEVIGATSRSE